MSDIKNWQLEQGTKVLRDLYEALKSKGPWNFYPGSDEAKGYICNDPENNKDAEWLADNNGALASSDGEFICEMQRATPSILDALEELITLRGAFFEIHKAISSLSPNQDCGHSACCSAAVKEYSDMYCALEHIAEVIEQSSDKMYGGSLREIKAEAAHEIWAHWMRYFLNNMCRPSDNGREVCFDREAGERWGRQSVTKFKDLSEKEKESDYAIAKEYL